MSLAFIVYLVTTLIPAISTIFALVAGLVFVYSLFIFVYAHAEIYDDNERSEFLKKSRLKTSAAVFVLGVFFSCLTPSKESSYAILAAYGVEEMAKNEKVQEAAGKSLEVLEKAMNEYLSESESNKE